MKDLSSIARAASARIRAAAPEIRHSLESIDRGRPGDAEPDELRKTAVVQARRRISSSAAQRLAKRVGPEATWGETIDFIDVAFFARGVLAARSVCRLAIGGRGIGTGFLISPRLLLTNNHVIESASTAREMQAEFDYELGVDGNPLTPTRFALAPQEAFVTSDRDDLDYTVVALGPRLHGSKELATFGALALSTARNKHALGDFVNIIQHPEARMKQAVVRDNQLVSRPKGGTVLHYVADTEPGSSGSPVFNVLWEVVALHHWGGPHRELFDERGLRVPATVNEGIRISAIVTDLQTRSASLPARARAWIVDALKRGVESSSEAGGGASMLPQSPPANIGPAMTLAADGTATWHIPLAVSVRLGAQPAVASLLTPGQIVGAPSAVVSVPADAVAMTGMSAGALPGDVSAQTSDAEPEAKFVPDENYDNREGYDPTFLLRSFIPLPKLSAKQKEHAAKNKQRAAGENPYELKYEHFSVVMNGKRRLAYFTATNIDGAKSKDVDRDSGAISEPERFGHDDESESAESSEAWFEDPRIEHAEQTPPDFYAKQTAFDSSGDEIENKRKREHLNRIFQQGHLTRRQDPTWGSNTSVLRANADTFHVSNRAPQVGYFNMGTSKPLAESKSGHPGGELHWRALEDWVLNNARADRQRVSVFCGPVFDEKNDPEWDRGRKDMRGFKAPLQYWKLVARVEHGELQATALLADQKPLIDYLPEALSGAEVRQVALDKVAKYHVSIAELERLTGLSFSKELREADTFKPKGKQKSRRPVETLHEVAAAPTRTRRPRQHLRRAAANRKRSARQR